MAHATDDITVDHATGIRGGTIRGLGAAALVAFLIAPVQTVPPRTQSFEGADVVALGGATVIDGTSGGPRRNATIVIGKDRILYVGDAAGVQLGNGVRRVDLTGRWIVPGFVDAHGHLPNRDGVASFLAQLVAFGTTTVRAAANPRVELRDLIDRGVVLGPTLLSQASSSMDRTRTVAALAREVRRRSGELCGSRPRRRSTSSSSTSVSHRIWSRPPSTKHTGTVFG